MAELLTTADSQEARDSCAARLVLLKDWIRTFSRLNVSSYYDFVMEHGRLWTAAPDSESWPKGTPRECFMNAARLALDNPELTYVEGVAVSVIPTAHAWCVDQAGQVIDPTWENPERCVYLGVPIQTGFLKQSLFESGVWGIMPEHIPESMRGRPSVFLAPRWADAVGVAW